MLVTNMQRGKKKTDEDDNDPKPLATQCIGQKYEKPFVYVVHG